MTVMTGRPDPMTRLAEMGLTLPDTPPDPIGAFCNVREHRGLLYISGQGPVRADGTAMTGKVGADVSADVARGHAVLVALNILSVARDHLGDLGRVDSVLKILGLVNATPDFERHPHVIDGASDVFHGVFGASGVHARSSFGVGSLPRGITVEIEAILTLSDT